MNGMHRSNTRYLSVRRSNTKRSNTGGRRESGIKVLYKPKTPIQVDVVFVPGLGAHPDKSWESEGGFNWASDKKDGLAGLCPDARILLYTYQSAWRGRYQVDVSMDQIARTLLTSLGSQRQDCPKRPIVMIGHSMGGLVIAKAVTITNSERSQFPQFYETMVGAAFFGTPWGGSDLAKFAANYAKNANRIGDRVTQSTLLDYLRPDSEQLRELKSEFMRLATRNLSPQMDLICFYEIQDTDWAKEITGIKDLFSLQQLLLPKNLSRIVPRQSATLDGVDDQDLDCNHRNLVKFFDPKDQRWNQHVKGRLKRMITGAPKAAKDRISCSRGIDSSLIRDVEIALSGESIEKKRETLSNIPESSWLRQEKDFMAWLGIDDSVQASDQPVGTSSWLWVRGQEGRGKTIATMAALNAIDASKESFTDPNGHKATTLLAYFFCEPSFGFSTAEDLLKSVILQLIRQERELVTHAQVLTKGRRGKNDSSSSAKTISIEKLWQALQDMLKDQDFERRVYIVLNNLHNLPVDSDSTIKLMEFLDTELGTCSNVALPQPRARWFITSRKSSNISNTIGTHDVRLIDLHDSRYENKFRMELKKHIRDRVKSRGFKEAYGSPLEYFVIGLLGKRAPDTLWINLTLTQLSRLPPDSRDSHVRRTLEKTPQDLATLLDQAWARVLTGDEDLVEQVKEMLRVLLLVYEDPSEEELSLLIGHDPNGQTRLDVTSLVKQCDPLVVIDDSNPALEPTVRFFDMRVSDHLRERSPFLLGMSEDEKQVQHGVMALRCFNYVKERLDLTESEFEALKDAMDAEADNDSDATSDASSDKSSDTASDTPRYEEENQYGDGDFRPDGIRIHASDSDRCGDNDQIHESETMVNNDKDQITSEHGVDTYAPGYQNSMSEYEIAGNGGIEQYNQIENYGENNVGYDEDDGFPSCLREINAYPCQYLFRHASHSTPEIAEELSSDPDFWEVNSRLCQTWLIAYHDLTGNLEDVSFTNWNRFHVAASVGFRQLLSCLIEDSSPEVRQTLSQRDGQSNTPLHLAARFGRLNTVEELLEQGADVNSGLEDSLQTPLHMAAQGGHAAVMEKLLRRKADPEAFSKEDGPVISNAIYAESRGCIELLVDLFVPLTMEENENLYSPLELAAMYTELHLFKAIVERYSSRIPPEEYSKALATAAYKGRLDMVKLLLDLERTRGFEYSRDSLQNAFDQALERSNWDVVSALMKHCPQGLKCEKGVNAAANSNTLQNEMLVVFWEYTKGTVDRKAVDSALYNAADLEKFETCQLLLDPTGYHADPNATGDEYGNALTAASFDGNLRILQLLLECKAEINSPNGWALQIAAEQGHKAIVLELLKNGADVNAWSDEYDPATALQAACESGELEIAKILLDHGANPERGGGRYSPPLVGAIHGEYGEIVEHLMALKVNVNAPGGPEYTVPGPIYHTAWNSPVNIGMCSQLVAAGARVDDIDEEGESALTIAAEYDEEDLVEFLLENGANILHVNKQGQNAVAKAMESDSPGCLRILVAHMCKVMGALKSAIDMGNTEIGNIVRTANLETYNIITDGESKATSSQDHHKDSGSLSAVEQFHIGTFPYYSNEADSQSQATLVGEYPDNQSVLSLSGISSRKVDVSSSSQSILADKRDTSAIATYPQQPERKHQEPTDTNFARNVIEGTRAPARPPKTLDDQPANMVPKTAYDMIDSQNYQPYRPIPPSPPEGVGSEKGSRGPSTPPQKQPQSRESQQRQQQESPYYPERSRYNSPNYRSSPANTPPAQELVYSSRSSPSLQAGQQPQHRTPLYQAPPAAPAEWRPLSQPQHHAELQQRQYYSPNKHPSSSSSTTTLPQRPAQNHQYYPPPPPPPLPLKYSSSTPPAQSQQQQQQYLLQRQQQQRADALQRQEQQQQQMMMNPNNIRPGPSFNNLANSMTGKFP